MGFTLNAKPDNAINVDGANFRRRLPQVFFQRLTSLNLTGVAVGSQQTIRFAGCNEAQLVYDKAKSMSAIPVAIAIVLSIRQNITIPVIAGSVRNAYASFSERRADDEILVNGGKATNAYLKQLPKRVGRLQNIMDAMVPGIVQTARAYHPDAQDLSQRAFSGFSDDVYRVSQDASAYRRPLFDLVQPRKIYHNGAAPITVPESSDAPGDLVVLPLTGDGLADMTVEGAGLLASVLFTSDSGQWTIQYTPRNRTGLYYNNGAGHTFGTFDIQVSLMWHAVQEDPANLGVVPQGYVWEINDALQTLAQGNNIFSADTVRDAQLVAFHPRYHDATTDGGNEFWQLVDDGPVPDYAPSLRIIPPAFNVNACFNTVESFLRITDGMTTEFPRANDLTTQGRDWLVEWNARYMTLGLADTMVRPLWGRELPLFSATGVATANTSLLTTTANGSVTYGAAYPGGAVTTIQVPNVNPGDLTAPKDVLVGLGGFISGYPLLWTDQHSKGFPGFGTRAKGDMRNVNIITQGAFALPTYLAGGVATAWPVTLWRDVAPYVEFQSPGDDCSCDPKEAKPLAANPSSPKAPLGEALSSTVTIPAAALVNK